MLDQIIGILASATVMAYSLYTFDAVAVPDNKSMMLTIPFVIYAVFRYPTSSTGTISAVARKRCCSPIVLFSSVSWDGA